MRRLGIVLVAVMALVVRVPAAGAAGLTLTVNTTADDDDGTCAPLTQLTDCTLREAITASNATAGVADTIAFNIPGAGPHTVAVASDLPRITDPVVIDGTTEPDFSGSPVVVVTGPDGTGSGFVLYAGDSTIRGLVINNFSAGIF